MQMCYDIFSHVHRLYSIFTSAAAAKGLKEEGYFSLLSFIVLFQSTQVWGNDFPRRASMFTCRVRKCTEVFSFFFGKMVFKCSNPDKSKQKCLKQRVSHTRRGSDLRRCQNWSRGETPILYHCNHWTLGLPPSWHLSDSSTAPNPPPLPKNLQMFLFYHLMHFVQGYKELKTMCWTRHAAPKERKASDLVKPRLWKYICATSLEGTKKE